MNDLTEWGEIIRPVTDDEHVVTKEYFEENANYRILIRGGSHQRTTTQLIGGEVWAAISFFVYHQREAIDHLCSELCP